ncbi:zinc-binding alcohol dehydrogenase [Paenibacillus qinlingensis]|uniref:Threonine dehydrogenase-like Zn-dependent dehydrogenase n=1 Tax=Paenibacillus qinlingensis TaxID=1837343 RepID=A0ABU1NNF9_9BACL|nr:zinc-binding alcohol dehydrogenase [Paenibacillus qinlingensis]MDR6549005.1 threonine dehydrogenase-like Zn-dependent dehydrogenase [Paenibacillus qinlingensis]
MPQQLVATAPRKAELVSYEEAPLMAGEVRVKVEYASPKHGSEIADFRGERNQKEAIYDQEWHAFMPPNPNEAVGSPFGNWNIGNQWVARITEIGPDVQGYELGERLCGYGGIRESHVVNTKNPKRLMKMPEDMLWKNAVCFDPAQFALGGIRDGQVKMGDRVAISGLGAIGAIAAQMAKLAGASYVAVIDPIQKRREAALRAGADEAFDPMSQDVGLELKKATDKLGVDVIIETSANEHALQACLRGLAYGGTIAFVGWARPFKGGLNLGMEAHFNNAKIVFSRACSEPNPDYPRWSWKRIQEVCWHLLATNQVNCEEIVDPVIPFHEAADGYEHYVDRKPEESIKLGVAFTLTE